MASATSSGARREMAFRSWDPVGVTTLLSLTATSYRLSYVPSKFNVKALTSSTLDCIW